MSDCKGRLWGFPAAIVKIRWRSSGERSDGGGNSGYARWLDTEMTSPVR